MFDPKVFTAPTARPLPVILLLDVSGSMQGAKIQNLNEAVRDMLGTFRDMENCEVEIHVAIITFGAELKLHHALSSSSAISWRDMSASGGTPLGTALKMAKAMIEDQSVITKRTYRPTVVLVSDGKPTDSWEQPMRDFIQSGRSSKCFRFALAIGADADEGVLGKFIEGTEYPLFYAENAKELKEFFEFMTQSVSSRSKSMTPDAKPDPNSIEANPARIEERKAQPDMQSRKKPAVEAASSGEPDGGFPW